MKKTYCRINDSDIIYILKNIKDGIATLTFKNKTVFVDKKNITVLENYMPRKETIKSERYSFTPREDNSQNVLQTELMLRLLTIEESLPLLDKFIDNAVVLKLPSVKIIHGKKGGVIRKFVHEYLSNCQFVESYTYAEYYDGSYGATIAKIKRWI